MSTFETAAGGSAILLHGWDARGQSWHGPIGLDPRANGRRIAPAKVRNVRGAFHFGRFRCSVPGVPCIEFATAIYDRPCGGLAIVHLEGPRGGPVAVLSVLPAERRERLHSDFPLELMTLVAMLSAPVNRGAEVLIHDYIEETLEDGQPATHAFALETALLEGDAMVVLSAYLESLAAAMLDWMEERQNSVQSEPPAVRSNGHDPHPLDSPAV
jgi:hypothetical protein